MSKTILFLLTISTSIVLLSGCITISPENLNYDSAKMVEKGSVELQGNFGYYPAYEQVNLGGKVGFGVSPLYNFKIRYESMLHLSNYSGSKRLAWHYLELENKIRISKWCAFSFPLCFYNSTEYIEQWFELKPALILSTNFSKQVDFSLIPKGHFLFGNGYHLEFFGISFGAGFSKNLDEWAIRPEIGWDQLGSLSCGIGFSYNLKMKKSD